MPTAIHIQGQFSYGLLPVFILFLLLLSPLFIKIYRKIKKKKVGKKSREQAQAPVLKPVPLDVKERYILELKRALGKYQNGQISQREVYQLQSSLIREFVLEFMNVDLTKKTLAEIRGMNMRRVERLIEEYYEDEFAPASEDGTENQKKVIYSINKTMDSIRKWN